MTFLQASNHTFPPFLRERARLRPIRAVVGGWGGGGAVAGASFTGTFLVGVDLDGTLDMRPRSVAMQPGSPDRIGKTGMGGE